ncbi:LacI family DNA-binding transcriptional regulator [Microbacterium trichothecenolyticum]|uniref:HTH-type transcriptional regulator DegA n=1 Tax=Microbacterium trichothecenolyticum TaxID=69370 RepID=A0A0M2HB06_MICTR|nr:LacI family DNA-binding transcriptional regulator [Microbacterium trichothecenolyticum]KJL41844.1 HTH-type transcriptional regulator DegA [Microbacterium trichothecenolyticum]
MSRPGIRQVAARAGVAVGTVSAYLNHPDRVSAERARRIAEAIDELGFVPSSAGRQLRLGVSSLIGYLSPDVSNPHFSEIAQEVEYRAERLGMTVFFAHSHGDREREDAYLEAFEQRQVRGILVSSFQPIEARLAAMRDRGTPSVLVGRRARDELQPSVSIDDVSGGRQAGEHLIANGCRRLAFVGGPLPVQQVADRLEGVRSAAAAASVDAPEVIEVAERSIAVGRAVGAALAARSAAERPDGVFAANDVLALGLLQALVAGGVAVPGEVALVGYDDNEFAEASLIPLTSVRARHDDFGAAAVDLLFESIEHGASPRADGTAAQRVYEPELIVRESSRRAH